MSISIVCSFPPVSRTLRCTEHVCIAHEVIVSSAISAISAISTVAESHFHVFHLDEHFSLVPSGIIDCCSTSNSIWIADELLRNDDNTGIVVVVVGKPISSWSQNQIGPQQQRGSRLNSREIERERRDSQLGDPALDHAPGCIFLTTQLAE